MARSSLAVCIAICSGGVVGCDSPSSPSPASGVQAQSPLTLTFTLQSQAFAAAAEYRHLWTEERYNRMLWIG